MKLRLAKEVVLDNTHCRVISIDEDNRWVGHAQVSFKGRMRLLSLIIQQDI